MEAVIFLLDADTLIFMIRGLKPNRRMAQRRRAGELVEKCQATQTAGDLVGLSAITVSELEYGARNSADYEAEIAAVRKVLAPFEIYDYEAVFCPGHYGRIRHDLERAGQTIGSMDLLTAAHAVSLEATLVTNNIAHFSRVPDLKVVNWVRREE